MTLPEASLLILAGGDSRRMGIPKHSMRISGTATVDMILDRIGPLFRTRMIAAREFGVNRPGLLQVLDHGTRRCPLAGILAGLLASPAELVFVIACDMPFATREMAGLLLEKSTGGADVTVPIVGGLYEPLFAVYTRSCIGPITDHLDSGRLKTTGFYDSVRVRTVSEREMREIDPGLESLVNLNTPRDLVEHCRPC